MNIEQIEYYLKKIRYFGGLGTDEIFFVNSNIYKYFVSEYIFVSLNRAVKVSKEELAGTFGKLLKRNYLSFRMKDFLRYKVQNGDLNKEMNKIIMAFQLMLDNGMTFYTKQYLKNVMQCEMFVFANMLDIIHFWEKKYYRFKSSIGIYLKYVRDEMVYCFPGGIECEQIDLQGIDLKNINLEGVSLRFFKGIDLEGVNLKVVDLRGADIRQINIERVDLKGLDLGGAFLNGLDLSEKDLKNTNLLGAHFDEKQVEYLEGKYELAGTSVLPNGSNLFISYEEYCKRR